MNYTCHLKGCILFCVQFGLLIDSAQSISLKTDFESFQERKKCRAVKEYNGKEQRTEKENVKDESIMIGAVDGIR